MIEFRKIWKCDYCNSEECIEVNIQGGRNLDSSMVFFPKKSLHLFQIKDNKKFDFCNRKCLCSWVVNKGTEEAFAEKPKTAESDDVPF